MNDEQLPSSTSRRFLQRFNALFSKQSSKEDLREYLQDAQDNHIIGTEEAAMLEGVLAFSEQRVRDVMLPKSKMVTVSQSMTFDEMVKLVIDSGHSRFPVEGDKGIIGILLAKDLLNCLHIPEEQFAVTDLMRPVNYIPESKRLDVMLREFRRRRLHMAIVTNEYGDVAGLITIEDVIEEIVGEIGDEHDREDSIDIRKISSNQYLVDALTEIEDFNHYFNTELNADTNNTIGGVILSQFGYVPKAGESIDFTDLHFTVQKADDRRVLDLLVSR